jgi:FKBP-type peptidyl-prolyl cis-trans isomerase
MDGVTLKVMSRCAPRTWALPKRGAGVSLSGKGLLPDGAVFQEWSEEAPLAFTIDEEQVSGGGRGVPLRVWFVVEEQVGGG